MRVVFQDDPGARVGALDGSTSTSGHLWQTVGSADVGGFQTVDEVIRYGNPALYPTCDVQGFPLDGSLGFSIGFDLMFALGQTVDERPEISLAAFMSFGTASVNLRYDFGSAGQIVEFSVPNDTVFSTTVPAAMTEGVWHTILFECVPGEGTDVQASLYLDGSLLNPGSVERTLIAAWPSGDSSPRLEFYSGLFFNEGTGFDMRNLRMVEGDVEPPPAAGYAGWVCL